MISRGLGDNKEGKVNRLETILAERYGQSSTTGEDRSSCLFVVRRKSLAPLLHTNGGVDAMNASLVAGDTGTL